MTQVLSTVGDARHGQPRRVETREAPTWFNSDSVALLHKALAKAAETEQEISLPSSEHYQMKNFEAYVTDRGDRDIVIQFIAPKCKTFEDVLPEIVEGHFGTTEGFKLHVEPQITSFGLLLEGVRSRPAFSRTHTVDNFLAFVDQTLSILKEA